MQVEMMDPARLTPYENNPRDNDASVPRVMASIREFGFKQPIVVDKDLTVIVGHTRLKAALELGLREVPVIVADDLDEDQAKAYRLADNKAGEESEWILPMLEMELSEIEMDMEPFGFEPSDADLGECIGDGSEDEVPDVEEVEPTVKRGQVWRLGEHRLMCGDSTSAEDVDRLMGGERAEMCFTSPPYNAGNLDIEIDGTIDKNTQRKYLEDRDQVSAEQYAEFLDRAVNIALSHCEEAFFNIGMVSGSKEAVVKTVNRHIGHFKDVLYWRKSTAAPHINKHIISTSVEPIWCFGENGTRAFRKEIGFFMGVIEGPSASASNEFASIHKATFPLYLPLEMVQTFTDPSETVLDLFGGTGTTMMACEQTNRKCLMMELEPRYCDVIIARWERATGRKAELVEG